MASEEELIKSEKQVVIRSRAKPCVVIHSAVPIDVPSSDDFVKRDGTDFSGSSEKLRWSALGSVHWIGERGHLAPKMP